MQSQMTPQVKAVFDAFPVAPRAGLLRLRALIFAVAGQTDGVGTVDEALRWGQPSYLTPQTKSGSTIRLGLAKTGGFAMFVNCRTRLIEDFRPIAPPETRYEGTRAVLFADEDAIDEPALRLLIGAALTYHLKR